MLVGGWCFRELGVVVVTSVDNIVEEPVQVCFFLLTSLLATTMFVNSAEKSLDTTAFVASWMVAVEVENNVNDRRMYVCMYVFNDRERTDCPKKTILGRK